MKPQGYVRILRPHQWLKNLIIFFPPLLSGALGNPTALGVGILPFFAFSFASSASYIVNDIIDCANDLRHPVKRLRPLPAGELTRVAALTLAAVLLIVALWLATRVSGTFLLFVLAYLAIALMYSLYLKNWPLLDIFCISCGFVFRLYGGGEAFGVDISDWLFLSVFLLAVFLSVGKRFSERLTLGEAACLHRPALEDYPPGFLEGAMYLSGASVIVTYAIYSISRPMLVYTVPFCMFGLLRFLMRIKSGQSGDPTEALVKDLPLLTVSVCWVLLVVWCIYQ